MFRKDEYKSLLGVVWGSSIQSTIVVKNSKTYDPE